MSALVIDETISPAEREDWDARLQNPETWLALKASAERMLAGLGYLDGPGDTRTAQYEAIIALRAQVAGYAAAKLDSDERRRGENMQRVLRLEAEDVLAGKLRAAEEARDGARAYCVVLNADLTRALERADYSRQTVLQIANLTDWGDKAHDRAEKAEGERDILREALEFYANPGSWPEGAPSRAGDRARAALAGEDAKS